MIKNTILIKLDEARIETIFWTSIENSENFNEQSLIWIKSIFLLIVFPILTFIFNIIFGIYSDALEDHRLAKRKRFIKYGLWFYIIGFIIYFISAVTSILKQWKFQDHENNPFQQFKSIKITFIIEIICFFVGHLMWSLGSEMIKIQFNSYILDAKNIFYQYQLHMTRTFCSGMAWFLTYFGICIFSGIKYFIHVNNEQNKGNIHVYNWTMIIMIF